MMYFQESGVAEREFERDVESALRRIYFSASGSAPGGGFFGMVPPGGGMLDAAIDTAMPLPWLREADLAEYVRDFTASGFRGGLNWYRNLHRNWELMAPFAKALIAQPALFIAGARDGVLRMPAMKSAVENLPQVLPALRGTTIIDGVGHWVQQEAPEPVNRLLIDFLKGLPA
jgi:pimeloyl-ACP methyl ester carboxylesterase